MMSERRLPTSFEIEQHLTRLGSEPLVFLNWKAIWLQKPGLDETVRDIFFKNDFPTLYRAVHAGDEENPKTPSSIQFGSRTPLSTCKKSPIQTKQDSRDVPFCYKCQIFHRSIKLFGWLGLVLTEQRSRTDVINSAQRKYFWYFLWALLKYRSVHFMPMPYQLAYQQEVVCWVSWL